MAIESENQNTPQSNPQSNSQDMAHSSSQSSPEQTGSTRSSTSRVDRPSVHSGVVSNTLSGGKTTIAEGVVSKVAGIAARAVPGVYALGGGGARAFGAVREAFTTTDLSQGVKVEVGETQAAVDLTLVVEYPAPIQDVCDNVRASVAGAITSLVGLEVVEINIAVNDVHLPGDENEHEESRVS